MKLRGTAKGANIGGILIDADRIAKSFFGEKTPISIDIGIAYAVDADPWQTPRTVFEAEFEATLEEGKKP